MEFIGQVHAGWWGEPTSWVRAATSFRNIDTGQGTGREVTIIWNQQPHPGDCVLPPGLRGRRGRTDSVPQPALRFHKIHGDCTSSSAFKGPHTPAAAIKCSQRHSCRSALPSCGEEARSARLLRPQPIGAGLLPAKRTRLEERAAPSRALRKYPVQILPPTHPRARTCANNAISRL